MMTPLIDLFVSVVQERFAQYCHANTGRIAYHNLVYQTHFYVKETVPIMCAVADAVPTHALAAHIREHAEAERGHDQLLVADLQRLGVKHTPELSPALRALVQLERGVPSERDPVSVLCGHIVVMEGYPPVLTDISRMTEQFGVDLSVAQGFLAHVEADIEHAEQAKALLSHAAINQECLLTRALTVCRHLNDHWTWMAGAT